MSSAEVTRRLATLLEAVAEVCGFNPEGGNRDHHYESFAPRSALAEKLRLSWSGRKLTEGFFLRAESFFNFATYIDGIDVRRPYGGKSLHEQSHGESFMSPSRMPGMPPWASSPASCRRLASRSWA